ncbi:hypothetical protein TNCV_1861461 [Trichonephila clavipes]|nr:hypothetical protein TNCV_1861461 [Trichonephila clavipes]
MPAMIRYLDHWATAVLWHRRTFGSPKIEGDIKTLTFFNGCRSSGCHAQMNTQPTKIFLHVRNEEMDRTIEQMFSC